MYRTPEDTTQRGYYAGHNSPSPSQVRGVLQPISSLNTSFRPSPLGPTLPTRSGTGPQGPDQTPRRGPVAFPSGQFAYGGFPNPARSDRDPTWEANLSLIRSAGMIWMGVSLLYILFVVAGLYIALNAYEGSAATTALLIVDAGIGLVSILLVALNLARPRNSWPNRLYVSCGMVVFLLIGCAAWAVGEVMQTAFIIQLSIVVVSVILMGSSIILSSWLRASHMQVADLVRSGQLQLMYVQEVGPSPETTDVTCGCRWLTVGIPRAWAERDNPSETEQLVFTQHGGSSSGAQVLTWPVYLKALGEMMFNEKPDFMQEPPHQPLASPMAVQLQGYPGSMRYSSMPHSDHDTPSGLSAALPLHSRIASGSSPPAMMIPGRRSPQPIVQLGGGIPFYENVPAEKADPSHQYYCPICMLYYGEVYKTHCCMNYMCQECSVIYVSGKRKKAEEAMLASLSLDYDSQAPFMASHIVECPFCQSNSMVLTRVNPWDGIKVYEDDDKSSDKMSRSSSCTDISVKVTGKGKMAAGKSKGKAKIEPSMRVAIGDSFDTLKTKMDYTGFVPQPLPGVAELEPMTEIAPDSPEGSNISQPAVGGESDDFVEGTVGDIILPNQMDFLPKGVEKSLCEPHCESQPPIFSSSMRTLDEAPSPAEIGPLNLEEGNAVDEENRIP